MARINRGTGFMRVIGVYSFNGGQKVMENKHPDKLKEIIEILDKVDAHQHKTKISKEKTMLGKKLFNPVSLNKDIKIQFFQRGWKSDAKVDCAYSSDYYVQGYQPYNLKPASRKMDFVSNRVGVEVQFGKYAFMVYNVAAKMTIFHKKGFIDVGVEIVPAKELQAEMSSGVSCFEQFVWDLDQRGVSNIDIPVLILGIVP
jgi:hypothetical protein